MSSKPQDPSASEAHNPVIMPNEGPPPGARSPAQTSGSEIRLNFAFAAELRDRPVMRIANWSRALDHHYRSLMVSGKPILDALRARLERLAPREEPETSEDAATAPRRLFQLPPECRWADVEIRRIDGHTVLVRAGNTCRRLSYYDFGLVSERTRAPVRQWEVLLRFCEGRGELPWSGEAKRSAVQRQISALRVSLQEVFGIEEDPIEYLPRAGYRSRFRALDEEDGE